MLISKTITGAMRLIGVTAVGEVPNANEIEDALDTLNSYIDTLNADGAMVTYRTISYWQPATTDLDPVLGRILSITKNPTYIPDPANPPQGFVYSEAPIDVLTVQLVDSAENIYKLEQIGIDSYTSKLQYVDVTGLPKYYTLNFNGDVLEVYFDVKWQELYTIVAMCKMPYLGSAGDYKATDDIDWEYGLERMLRTNLAVRLAPEYGVQVPPTVYEEAKTLENTIRNKGVNVAEMDTGLTTKPNSTGNINDGWSR